MENGEQMDAILRALGFSPTFRYEKYRAEWSDGTGHAVIDETPIGNFGELEGPARWIDRTAQAAGDCAARLHHADLRRSFLHLETQQPQSRFRDDIPGNSRKVQTHPLTLRLAAQVIGDRGLSRAVKQRALDARFPLRA